MTCNSDPQWLAMLALAPNTARELMAERMREDMDAFVVCTGNAEPFHIPQDPWRLPLSQRHHPAPHSKERHLRYVGCIAQLHGRTALVCDNGVPGQVVAQFDYPPFGSDGPWRRHQHRMCFGWHPFPATVFVPWKK